VCDPAHTRKHVRIRKKRRAKKRNLIKRLVRWYLTDGNKSKKSSIPSGAEKKKKTPSRLASVDENTLFSGMNVETVACLLWRVPNENCSRVSKRGSQFLY